VLQPLSELSNASWCPMDSEGSATLFCPGRERVRRLSINRLTNWTLFHRAIPLIRTRTLRVPINPFFLRHPFQFIVKRHRTAISFRVWRVPIARNPHRTIEKMQVTCSFFFSRPLHSGQSTSRVNRRMIVDNDKQTGSWVTNSNSLRIRRNGNFSFSCFHFFLVFYEIVSSSPRKTKLFCSRFPALSKGSEVVRFDRCLVP
jgi:hypothetical protein